MNLQNEKVELVNSTLKDYPNLIVSEEIYDLTGKRLLKKVQHSSALSNRLAVCFKAELPTELPPVYLVRLSLADGKIVLSENEYWMSTHTNNSIEEFNHLSKPVVVGKILKKDENKFLLQVSNKSKVPAIGLRFNLRNLKTGKRILPAYFSDAYFTLLPGEIKITTIEADTDDLRNSEVTVEGYNFDLVVK